MHNELTDCTISRERENDIDQWYEGATISELTVRTRRDLWKSNTSTGRSRTESAHSHIQV